MKHTLKSVRTLAATLITIGSLAGGAYAATLTTTFAGGNGQNGNMFDINIISTTDLLVTSLDLHLGSFTTNIEVYGRTGSWVGLGTSSVGWTLLSTTSSVTGNGIGVSTMVNVADFVLPSLSTYALYITSTTPIGVDVMQYTNGTSIGNVFAQNSDLQILEGAGKSYAFGSTFQPRNWNGTITYEAIPEPSSALLAALGALGLVTSRRRIK